ncbi:universal stress protein [Deinococcus lacus]|uniref:Universal stress protein n=1 Tax=Deinococcus lacus TaxID=392561 RepID=A0ABW1YF54_9DEIO
MNSFQRIAIGIDFSPSSLYALEIARTRFPGAALRLLHAVDIRATPALDPLGSLSPMALDPQLIDTVERGDAQKLAALLRPGEEHEQLLGDPVTSLLEAARQWEADLLVVGTHASTALEHFFLGSTAEKLVARSRIPVLTVRFEGPA